VLTITDLTSPSPPMMSTLMPSSVTEAQAAAWGSSPVNVCSVTGKPVALASCS
jgi:hypothetical protein